MTIGTIIAIALGVTLLVFLIFGFSRGWNNLWDTVNPLAGGKANVDDIARACEVACASGDTYNYCTENRTIRVDDNTEKVGTCFEQRELLSVSCSNIQC